MNMLINNKLRGGLAALGLFVLVGCANNQTAPSDETASKGAAVPEQATKEPEPAPTRVVVPPKPQIEIVNPTAVAFEKMSVTLDDKAREAIGYLAEKARTSGKITVTGFCDRKQIRNAMDSAVARAVVTRDELITLGVNPSNVTVKFSTVVAKKHAAEIKFEELELTKTKKR